VKARALTLVALAAAAACAGSQGDAVPAWPAGTVLALGDRPICAAEVDEAANCIAQLEPRDSFDQLRRLALTNVVLPRCAAQAIDPEARKNAQRLAEQVQRALAAHTAVHDAQPLERKGRMLDLGLELWNAAMALQPGQLTGVVETAGCFHVALLKEKSAAVLPGLVELTLEVYDFPYLPAGEAHERIDAQLDRSQLVYVDESWRAHVPIVWQHRLRGGSP
jgi:hypothetical protein